MTLNQTIKHYPLSSPQLDLWFNQVLHPDVPLYNIGGYVRIEGAISPARFEKALNQVIEENDALRIILHEGESLPTQTFAENVGIQLDFQDFSETENAHNSALKWIEQAFVKPFQLYDGLLFQFALCKVSERCYYWLKKYHHLIVDGWAISLIVQRVAVAYNALSIGKTSEPTNFAYHDFIQKDQAYLESEEFVKAKHYWQNKYREVPEPLLVHRYASQILGKTAESQRSTLCLKRAFYTQLNEFAEEYQVSPFHVILGALYCYFLRTSDREDLSIGLLIWNRGSAAFQQTVGLFVGVNPAWFRFGTDLNFVELVEKISNELQQDYRHQRFPIGEINQQIGPHKLLFDLTLSYAKHDFDTHFNGNRARTFHLTNGFIQNALAIFIEEFQQPDDVNVYFEYNFGFFDEAEIERLKARFEFLLGEIIQKPSVPVRALQIMPDAELKKILREWNDTATDFPRDKTIVDLFEEQVDKTPDAIAVVFENQQLTYQELNTKANQLAHYLQALGVKPEVLVGICIERSIAMVIGLLGILKAGGAYVPLEPAYPKARLGFMLIDSQVSVLLTQSDLTEKLSETTARLVCLDVEVETLSRLSSENIRSGVEPENLAYVIYTSGSSGKPKGTLIIHQGLVNYLSWSLEHYQVASGLGAPVHSPIGFDATITSLFLPLLAGQRILLLPTSAEPDAILAAIHSFQNWSFVKLTPAHLEILNTLLPEELSGKTRFLILGGEALFGSNLSLWRIGAPETRIINEYGPTEAVVGCCVYEVDANTPRKGAVPIGRPIANTQLYILDKFLQPLPIGVPGELYIGGAGVARGYLNRPELTAEKFICNPFSEAPNWLRRAKDSRLYKTGDLARFSNDGHIEYLGRIDNQVKIRGFRIELSEIEAVLVTHPDVSDAVVIAREDEPGEKRLLAYIVSELIPTRIPYQTKCLLKYEDKMVSLQTVEICTTGALLEGDMSFEKGKEISLLLQLPGEEQTCWLKGRIAYLRRSTAGVEFKLTPQEQVLMEKGVTYELENKGFLNFLQYSLRDKLRQALEEKLPSYMVPSDFVLLMSLPLTPNGKIDRRALSQLSVSYQLSDKTFVAPRTPDEELLAGIWASVLNVERVGVHDNFFELGGHSLLAVSLLAQIEQQFGKHLPLAALFQGATIAELARLLKPSIDTTNQWAPLVAIQPHGSKRPCVAGAGGNVLYFHQLARHLGEEQPFYGLQAVGLDGKTAPDTRVEDMASRYIQEIQAVQQMPYLLGGYSFGADVALEMSKQLQLKGQKVARLFIFDSTVPLNQPIGLDWDEAQWIMDIARIIERLLNKNLNLSLMDFQQLEPTAQVDLLYHTLADNDWAISKKQLYGLLKTFKANCQAEYVPQDIQSVPITLFIAEEMITETASGLEMELLRERLKQQADWGWSQYASGPVDVHVVPGDHYTMMSQPHVQVLAEKLRVCLDKV
jgi:amino acid adenylation domain-containing protein